MLHLQIRLLEPLHRAEPSLQVLNSLLVLLQYGVVRRTVLLLQFLAVLQLFLEIIDLGFVSFALILLFQYLILFVLEEVLYLLIENADLRYVFLVQSAHLLEHLRGELRAFLIMLLVPEFQHILQFVYPRLLVIELAFELKQRRIVLILSFRVLSP